VSEAVGIRRAGMTGSYAALTRDFLGGRIRIGARGAAVGIKGATAMGVPIHEAIGYEPLQRLFLDVAQLRALDAFADGGGAAFGRSALYRGVDSDPGADLLALPGDICGTFPIRSECPDRARSLHLVAGAGRSVAGVTEW
jgi:hypothetical protein